MLPHILPAQEKLAQTGFAHLAALGLVSIILRCVIVKTVQLADLIGMCNTDCFGETRLVPHVPSSS